MKSRSVILRALALGIAAALLLAGAANAAEVRVMISGGLTAAYKALVPEFEKATGNKVITAYGPSMGTTRQCDPGAAGARRARRRPDPGRLCARRSDQAGQGRAPTAGSIWCKSPIGIAVKAGAPKPDISSADAVKRALLAAKSVAYSDSASGVYVSTEMFAKLGIADEMKDKARKIPATPVGEIVAKGEAEIGLQQISELKPVAGIDIVGPLPDELAEDHGVLGRHRHRLEGARGRQGADQVPRLSGGARTIVKSGLEPIARRGDEAKAQRHRRYFVRVRSACPSGHYCRGLAQQCRWTWRPS